MTPSLNQQQVETAIRAFLTTTMPQAVEVMIGQANRVPEPTADNFVIIWATLRRRLGTTLVAWDESQGGNPATQTNTEALRLDMQFDFHGANSTDNAQVFATLFRSDYACQFFTPFGLTPNYCSDGNQAPFINGEQQYEDRWTLTATFDANIAVQTPQQFADTVAVETVSSDELAAFLIFEGDGVIDLVSNSGDSQTFVRTNF